MLKSKIVQLSIKMTIFVTVQMIIVVAFTILKMMIKHTPNWSSNKDNSIILHNVFDNLDTEQAQELLEYCFNDTKGCDLRQTLDNSVFTNAFYSYVNNNENLRDIYFKYLFDKTETNIYDLSTDPKECEKYYNQYHKPKSVVIGGLLVGLATRNLELFYSGCRTLDTIPDKSTIKTSHRNHMKRNLNCLEIIKQWGLDKVITTSRATIDEYDGYNQFFTILDKQLLQLVILCMCLLDREQSRYYHPRKTLTQKLGSNLRSLCELYDWEKDKIFKRVIPSQFSQFFDLPSEN